jgi:hypothetical protein
MRTVVAVFGPLFAQRVDYAHGAQTALEICHGLIVIKIDIAQQPIYQRARTHSKRPRL